MPFRKKAPVSWLIVGLGNPGARFENTRHNVGFWAVDELARRADVAVRKIRFHALTADAVVGCQGVLLMKPTTFMNLSGQAVGEAARCLAGLEGADMVQVAVTRTRPAGRYHLMDAQNPVWIFSGEGRA